jgi:hypothetical protein
VTLPPGFASDATMPDLTGSTASAKTIGMVEISDFLHPPRPGTKERITLFRPRLKWWGQERQ